jgi:hypothetical protein
MYDYVRDDLTSCRNPPFCVSINSKSECLMCIYVIAVGGEELVRKIKSKSVIGRYTVNSTCIETFYPRQ